VPHASTPRLLPFPYRIALPSGPAIAADALEPEAPAVEAAVQAPSGAGGPPRRYKVADLVARLGALRDELKRVPIMQHQ
jgi:hypothetical protein